MFRFYIFMSVTAAYTFGAAVGQTPHYGRSLQLINDDRIHSIVIRNMTLSHVLQNGSPSPLVTTLENIWLEADGGASGRHLFDFPVDPASDYWFLELNIGSQVWSTKSSFKCNMKRFDFSVVELHIDTGSVSVWPSGPNGSSCSEKLYPMDDFAHGQRHDGRDGDLSLGNVPKEPQASFSMKYAKFIIENKFGSEILVEELTHYLGNNAHDPSNTVVTNLTIEANGASKPYDFAFANGFLPPRDYWYVQVRIGAEVLKTKNNFYCNMTSNDTGTTKLIIDILNKKVLVIPPVSSSCQVALQ